MIDNILIIFWNLYFLSDGRRLYGYMVGVKEWITELRKQWLNVGNGKDYLSEKSYFGEFYNEGDWDEVW